MKTVRVVALFSSFLLATAHLPAQHPYAPPMHAPLPRVVQGSSALPPFGPTANKRSLPLNLIEGLFPSKAHGTVQQVSNVRAVAADCGGCGEPSQSCGCSGGYLSAEAGYGNVVGTDLGCGACGEPGCGGCGTCLHRVRLYGEYLYLRARNAEVPYAVPIDGAIAPVVGNGIQIGPVAAADLDYDSGFRAGFAVALNDGAQIGARFTDFDTRTSDQVFVEAPNLLRALVTHPQGNNAAVDTLRASSRYDIEFELVDFSYQAHWKCTDRLTLDYVLGVRYGELGQEFHSEFETNGTTSVDTGIDFNGTGPRIGLDLQRHVGQLGLFLYTRGDASFLAGKSRARYNQSDAFAGTIVDTNWESGRVVTQLDFELGFGWSDGKAINISTGYLISSWFNTVRTDEFIQSVQTNQYSDLGDGITFDGLVIHGELRF